MLVHVLVARSQSWVDQCEGNSEGGGEGWLHALKNAGCGRQGAAPRAGRIRQTRAAAAARAASRCPALVSNARAGPARTAAAGGCYPAYHICGTRRLTQRTFTPSGFWGGWGSISLPSTPVGPNSGGRVGREGREGRWEGGGERCGRGAPGGGMARGHLRRAQSRGRRRGRRVATVRVRGAARERGVALGARRTHP